MSEKTITLKGEIVEIIETLAKAQGQSVEAFLRELIHNPPIADEREIVPEKEDWSTFLKRTYGSLADDPIERPPQPPYEEREPLE